MTNTHTTTYRRLLPRAQVPRSLTARQVAAAYHYPTQFTGRGTAVGIIELGGGFGPADLQAVGIDPSLVTAVPVAGGANRSDGANGADGEVLLDIEVVMEVAPAAKCRVYFAPNTDHGFLAAIKAAHADGVDAISISWGGPETSWDKDTALEFDAEFEACRRDGITVYCASGDQGSTDGTSANVADFPASSPNVIACGGTMLTVDDAGEREAEVAWDDDDRSSASGGGLSRFWTGRAVPDVAGNASPNSGYEIRVDGEDFAIGGTSAVAPLYAGLHLLLSEAVGGPLGRRVDFMNTLLTNLGVCFDITSGDNGGFRAGLGRDQVTGLGVVDGGKLLAVLTDTVADPAPFPGDPVAPDPGVPGPEPVPAPAPTPAPPAGGDPDATLVEVVEHLLKLKSLPRWARRALQHWLDQHRGTTSS